MCSDIYEHDDDEYAFIHFNDIIYKSASPAQSQAGLEAKNNGKPYGILMTSTPGDLSTKHGASAKRFIDNSAKFVEKFYDWDIDRINEYIKRNSRNKFTYIKFTYKQLGRSEEWFEEQCYQLDFDEFKIRREILLEWNKSSDISPFRQEDLDEIRDYIKEPFKTIMINKYYALDLYSDFEYDNPMMVGVDVSGGYSKDSSSVVVTSSVSKKTIADFNNNSIGINDLSKFLFTLINNYMPNAVLCIERNSYGEGVISNLQSTNVSRNLYFEYRRMKIDEKVKDGYTVTQERTAKIYGVITDKDSRAAMMELLRETVNNNKQRFVSPKIMKELDGLEYKKGRIDHGSTTHDDTIFGFLMTMYVYYYGTNLSHFGIIRFSDDFLKKMEEEGQSAPTIENNSYDPIMEMHMEEAEQNPFLNKQKTYTYEDLEAKREEEVQRWYQQNNIGNANTPVNVNMGNTVHLGKEFFKSLYDDM